MSSLLTDGARLVEALCWPAVTAYGLWRYAPVLTRFAPGAGSVVPVAVDMQVPDDLVAFAMQEREAWAQEEVLRAVRERYDTLRDWNKVRAAVGIGRIDP